MTRRFAAVELMDDDSADPAELRRALLFIRRVNAGLGYNRAVIRELRRAGCGANCSLLDVATGSADLPDLTRRRLGCSVVGLDRHAGTLAVARAWAAGVPVVRGDALRLPFDDRSVDYVTANLFLHHLPDELVVAALREMGRVARRAVVAADLLPGRRALAWITLFTLAADPMTRHDARLSVRQAIPLGRARELAADAGLTGADVRRAWGHRFLLTWRRP